jgi:hypothetical protein
MDLIFAVIAIILMRIPIINNSVDNKFISKMFCYLEYLVGDASNPTDGTDNAVNMKHLIRHIPKPIFSTVANYNSDLFAPNYRLTAITILADVILLNRQLYTLRMIHEIPANARLN